MNKWEKVTPGVAVDLILMGRTVRTPTHMYKGNFFNEKNELMSIYELSDPFEALIGVVEDE